jgi:hypothetical protein
MQKSEIDLHASTANIADSENCRNKEKGEKGKFITG